MFSISYNFNFNLLCRYFSYEAFVHCSHWNCCCCACCSFNICFVYFCEYTYADFLENLPMYWSGKHCFLSLFLLYASAYFVSEMRNAKSFFILCCIRIVFLFLFSFNILCKHYFTFCCCTYESKSKRAKNTLKVSQLHFNMFYFRRKEWASSTYDN